MNPPPSSPCLRVVAYLTPFLACLSLGSLSSAAPPTASQASSMYGWPQKSSGYAPLSARVQAPPGFKRVGARPGSYAFWLRHLPVRPAGTSVRAYNGRVILPSRSSHLAAVVDMDVGRSDLQQCWDSILRLRAEYLWSVKKGGQIRFPYAGGLYFSWSAWRQGLRPRRVGRRFILVRTARPSGETRLAFSRYLRHMFAFTGTIHGTSEPKIGPKRIAPGDFFLQAGSPGHAVMVLDVATSRGGGIKVLLGQGFMPAQDFHVLHSGQGSGWFDVDPDGPGLKTPFWRMFSWADLRRHRY